MKARQASRAPAKAPRSVTIPSLTALEKDLPVEFMCELALREGNRKKPIYEIHKWWARRLGSCFRMLLLGATTPAARTEELADGAFYDKHEFDGLVVLDPFVGGGTSVIESLKCGASAIAVDVDPVACEVTRREVERVNPHPSRSPKP